MSAVPNPTPTPRRGTPRRAVPRPTTPPAVLPVPARPLWFVALSWVQQVTTPLALGAGIAAVGAYTLTVYQWQTWNQVDRDLARLRQKERQLQFDSATREQELARAAEQSALVLWNPEKTIFLKPVPLPEKVAPQPVPTPPPPTSPQFPLAY